MAPPSFTGIMDMSTFMPQMEQFIRHDPLAGGTETGWPPGCNTASLLQASAALPMLWNISVQYPYVS